MSEDVTVLSVYGSGRSGTTLIGTLLGQHSGVFYAGELYPLWGPGWLPDELCSCGRPVVECPVWSQVLSKVIRGEELTKFILEMRYLRDSTTRARHILFPHPFRQSQTWHEQQQQFVVRTKQLYQAIYQVTGCRTIVDTSKHPSYSVLMAVGGLDLRFVHVVRDPRGVVSSWRRRKAWYTAKGAHVRQQGLVSTVLLWSLQNALAEMLLGGSKAYLRVRYEDFVHEPARTLRAIAKFAGISEDFPGIGSTTFALGEHHSIGGNPSRILQTEVAVTPDEEWLRTMTTAEKLLVWLLSLPLSLRHGYPAIPSKQSVRLVSVS